MTEAGKKIFPKNLIKENIFQTMDSTSTMVSADILLNDHWEDMREKGFVSNRIYDGLACGAFILTDMVKAMGELREFVQTYETPEELKSRYRLLT